jgi:hypothetical protein
VLIVDDHASRSAAAARTLLEADGYRMMGEAADDRSALCEADDGLAADNPRFLTGGRYARRANRSACRRD